MDCSTPGHPVHHQLPEFTQTHVHWVEDAIQSPHSVVLFSSSLQSFPASGCFQMNQSFTSGGQSIGVVVWYSHLLNNYSRFIVIHKVQGCGIVNKAEVDIFLELSCFFDDPTNFGNLISGPSAFSKPAWISGSSWFTHLLLKPGLENLEHYFAKCVRWVQLCGSLNIL